MRGFFSSVQLCIEQGGGQLKTLYRESGVTEWCSGGGTALQTGSSRVRFPMVSLWLWVPLSLKKNENQHYFLGVKVAVA
jgi:hypothetical protein